MSGKPITAFGYLLFAAIIPTIPFIAIGFIANACWYALQIGFDSFDELVDKS